MEIVAEKDEQTIKFLNRLFDTAKKWKYYYTGDKHKRWIDDIRWYKGIQWQANRPKEKSSIFFNRLFSLIQKELPFMTDRAPKIYINPKEPSDKIPCEIFKKLIAQAWVERDMELKLPEGVMHAKQLGMGFFRPYWNPTLAGGLGDVDCDVVDPFEIFPFSYTSNLETCEGVCWARWVSLGWVKKNFENGDKVKASKTDGSDVPDRCKVTNAQDGNEYEQVTDTTGSETHYLPNQGGSSTASTDYGRVLLKAFYIKDSSLKDYEGKDEKKKKTKVAAYPNGRTIIIADSVILSDEPYPFENFPGFIAFPNYINPSEFWGISDITQIKEGQKELNKLQAMIIDAVRRGVYTTKFLQTQSGITSDDFQVTSDAIYETNIPNPVTELVPQALPPQIFNYSQQIEQAIEKTAGVADYNAPTSGDLPSGTALANFAEMAQTRLRQKLRNMEYAIRMIGKCWLEMMLKNYTEQRIMRVMNSNSGEFEYVLLFKEEDDAVAAEMEKKYKAETIPGTEQQGPDGQPVPDSGQPKYQYVINMAKIKGEMDLMVGTASTVATSKVASFEQAFQLYQAGIIDQQAVLEAIDYQDKEEVMKRMSESQAAAQQMNQAVTQSQIQETDKNNQANMQMTQMQAQATMQKTQLDNQTKLQIEQIKAAAQMQLDRQRLVAERLGKREDIMMGGNNGKKERK